MLDEYYFNNRDDSSNDPKCQMSHKDIKTLIGIKGYHVGRCGMARLHSNKDRN